MRQIAFLLALACGPAGAEWTQVAADASTTTYADTATREKSGDTTRMISLVDYRAFQRMVEVGYFSRKVLAEYDCAKSRSRQIALWLLEGRLGAGKSIYTDETAGEWEPVAAASAGEALYKAACP